jgi:uncharacterized membrane protein YagU involved in acid resistance
MSKTKSSLLNAILGAWLIVGTLDLAAAMIQTIINNGSIVKLLQFIASGVFGVEAFVGGATTAVYGTLFHYGIALMWTVIFFMAYPVFKLATKNKVVTGVVYGLVVWVVMNRLVLPLSNITQRPFDATKSILAAAVLIVAIGLPLSYLAHRYSTGSKPSR